MLDLLADPDRYRGLVARAHAAVLENRRSSTSRAGEQTWRALVARSRRLSRQTQSRRACASGRPSSFFSVLFSICRMRSRVTPNALPTSSSVHG